MYGYGNPDVLYHAALRQSSVEPQILRDNRTQQVIRQASLKCKHGVIQGKTPATPPFTLPSVTPTTSDSPPPLPSEPSKTSLEEIDSSIGVKFPLVETGPRSTEVTKKSIGKKPGRKTRRSHGMQLRSCRRCILYELNTDCHSKTRRAGATGRRRHERTVRKQRKQ